MSVGLENCACMNLRKSARLVAQFYDQRLEPSDIRITQFTLLAYLKHAMPVSISELANKMGMSRTTLTRNIKLMEREGLSKSERGEDVRVRLLSITEKGVGVFEETRPYWAKAHGEFLDKFGQERWGNLLSELTDVNQVLAEA